MESFNTILLASSALLLVAVVSVRLADRTGLPSLLIYLGVAFFAQRIVRPFAQLLGWPATRITPIRSTLAAAARPRKAALKPGAGSGCFQLRACTSS